MRVLQLTSDWKWTGPAEPMLRLGLGLRARGHHVWMACPLAPEGSDRSLASEAVELGLAPDLEISRGRGARLLADRDDVRRLRRFLDDRRVDVVHTWHTRDHVLALRAAGWRPFGATGPGSRRVALVRSWRMGEPPGRDPATRFLFGPGADGLLCVSPGTADACAPLRAGRPLRGVFGAVDLERFRPGTPDAAVRAELGLEAGHHVVGIVARVQPHRRFDLLLEAARLLFERDPAARLLVIGRGTKRAQVAEEPARRLGISDRVVFAGYRRADYAEVLRAIDVFTFLVPGSDGTCRALLEAQACGIPAVTTRRGALGEIVEDGETGRLVEEDPERLAAAWAELLADAALRRSLGEQARKRAELRFGAERLATEVEALYREALGR